MDRNPFVEVDEERLIEQAPSQLPELEFLLLLKQEPERFHELLNDRIQYLETDDARLLSRMPFYQIAFQRSLAIVSTLILELGVGIIISKFTRVIRKQMLFTSFLPILSAISGNVGLQASTSTLRALSAGSLLFVVAWVWSVSSSFGFITGISIFINCALAGIMGSLGPLVFKLFEIDPALMAGPFETAVQDLIGTTVYLGLGTWWLLQ
ncbi:hypothetical protein EDD86DRAFT_250342 [Gorgonomyces haynaldii]|nr:hypothetical protein EDD86DRAFT_250342 [Gorgonomyces haynaldii]